LAILAAIRRAAWAAVGFGNARLLYKS